jgi:threonine aldolase
MNPEETMALALSCERFLSGGDPHEGLPKRVLEEMAETTPADWQADTYGEGRLIEEFEREVGELLGKPEAVFMPSGTMAQQIALRIWSEQRGTHNVAFHPKCHLEIHEQKGYQALHGLHGVLVGNPNRLLTLDDLQQVADPLAAILLELPQREIGGVLPTWEELTALTGWARRQGIPLHMDGARLWECGPYYGRSYAEIAGPFDSVYVSFYKGLGGISGAVLAGPEDLIREARIWLRRHGGNLYHLWPYVLAARQGFQSKLPRMAAYHAKAVEVAAALSALPGIALTPNPPHTNMMHVFLKGDPEKLLSARDAIAKARKDFLFFRLSACQIPGYAMFELTVVDGGFAFTPAELQSLFKELLERAKQL